MIGIVDYGRGNILSVKNALEIIGAKVKVCQYPEEVLGVDKIIIPGVGSFTDGITSLRSRGFIESLNEMRLKGKPILGICLGMQMMAQKGFEGGECPGLGWFDAEVMHLKSDAPALRVPHIGWNNIECKKESFLFKGLPRSPDFYFVHSFYMKCRDEKDILAVFEYGGCFTAAIQKDNLVATQFHPEKSQDYGLTVLNNFVSWNYN